VLRQGLQSGLPISNLAENWDFLQMQCALLINSDCPGVPAAMQAPGRPLRCARQPGSLPATPPACSLQPAARRKPTACKPAALRPCAHWPRRP
jgi:hypothetical protein